ncbi:hypothetical protein [Pseudomonas sp. NPDC089734]|uniref:hypothetical protein n=1 Tax=Pseudomonas sp. NPDC089734 TaxID=3364469 RepID=UPI00380AE922
MNSLNIAHLRISSLHIQQGLFVVLALLVTLIAVQQFQRWESSREAPQVQQTFIKGTASFQSLRQTTLNTEGRQQPMSGMVSVDEVATPQKWVF